MEGMLGISVSERRTESGEAKCSGLIFQPLWTLFFILHVEHFSLDVKMKCNLKQ